MIKLSIRIRWKEITEVKLQEDVKGLECESLERYVSFDDKVYWKCMNRDSFITDAAIKKTLEKLFLDASEYVGLHSRETYMER